DLCDLKTPPEVPKESNKIYSMSKNILDVEKNPNTETEVNQKEERKSNEGNDIEMISIGSNLRLEHLEE
ncbi:MAG: hypothetical protein ACKO96_38615, partial [Flammeovirgaceae bacterium]